MREPVRLAYCGAMGAAVLCALTLGTRSPADAAPGQQPVRLLLELTLPADPTVYFGGVADADLLEDGSVLVLDQLNRTIYRFTAAGELVDSIGREGAGPGELRGPVQLELAFGGEIVVADALNGRLSRWAPSGRHLGDISLPGGQFVRGMWSTPGGLWVQSFGFGREETAVAFHRLRSAGDSLAAPRVTFMFRRDPATLAVRGISCEYCPATVTPRDDVLVAAPDTVYRVAEIRDGGTAVRRWQRSGVPAVRRTADEIEAIRSRMSRASGPPVPFRPQLFAYKPRFASLEADDAGRLWALRSPPAEGPVEIDVFGADTRFLMTLSIAEPVRRVAVRAGRVLGIGEDRDGEPRVYVYRIHGPGTHR